MVKNDAFFWLYELYLSYLKIFCPADSEMKLLSREMMKETIEPPIGRIFMAGLR